MIEKNKPEEEVVEKKPVRRYISLSNEELNELLADYRRSLKKESEGFRETLTDKILELEQELGYRHQQLKTS
jgi:hypothetical protein